MRDLHLGTLEIACEYAHPMAIVRSLQREKRASSRVHPTEVDCRWTVVEGEQSGRLFQLSTYGSDQRQSEPKVSQTLQLDREVASALIDELKSVFEL